VQEDFTGEGVVARMQRRERARKVKDVGRLTLGPLPVLRGERVILRERRGSSTDDRLRYPSTLAKTTTTARRGGGTVMAAVITPASTWPPAMGQPSPVTAGGGSST
jgi:hypothetical protein